ncbi:hypothetical protein ABT299_13155 [Spirillospora sp. NPDC000708]
MESETLPVWVPLGCALVSIACFTLHRRISSGKISERYKEYLFLESSMDGGRGTGLGGNCLAVAFGFWALGGFFSYAPLESLIEPVVMGCFIAGFASVLPLVYWRSFGYPESVKPDWYKAREAARRGGAANIASTAEVDDMVLAGAAGWEPLEAVLPGDASGGRPAEYHDSGTACLEVAGYRLVPLVLEIGSDAADLLWAWAGLSPTAVNDWLAFVSPGHTSARVVLDDRELADGAPLAVRYVRIEARGSWRVTVQTVDDLPTFEAAVGGGGLEVLRYVGPPGIAVFWQDDGAPFSLKLRDSVLGRRPGPKQILCEAPGEKGRVALSSGSVLEIGSGAASWHIQVSPLTPSEDVVTGAGAALEGPGLDEIRTFDTAVRGDRAEVLLYTGELARLRVEHRGDGPFGIDRLSSSLAIVREVLSTTGVYQGEIEMLRHTLIQIRGGTGAWSLRRTASGTSGDRS